MKILIRQNEIFNPKKAHAAKNVVLYFWKYEWRDIVPPRVYTYVHMHYILRGSIHMYIGIISVFHACRFMYYVVLLLLLYSFIKILMCSITVLVLSKLKIKRNRTETVTLRLKVFCDIEEHCT